MTAEKTGWELAKGRRPNLARQCCAKRYSARRCCATTSLSLLLLLSVGCAGGQGEAQIGYSTGDKDSEGNAGDQLSEEPGTGDGPLPRQDEEDDEALGALSGEGEDEGEGEGEGEDVDEAEAESEDREPEEAALARSGLERAPSPDNHLALKFAVVERASDLPWIFVAQNVSKGDIELGALPSLISFSVTKKSEEEPEATPETPAGKTAAKPEEPVVCSQTLPKAVSTEEKVLLKPGQLLYHAFDPREICADETALAQGSTVKLTYGFPTQTKKVWKAGKMEEVETEQTAPFVAERLSDGEEKFLPLKHLAAPEFKLGSTYPLSSLTALPASTLEDSADPEGDADKSKTAAPPPPPLVLSVSPLGTTSAPEAGSVTVRMKNQSQKSIRLFMRRELFSYEVVGPEYSTTCQMHPADRHPSSSEFVTVGAGSSYTLTTRMAEACPKGTFDAPGTYYVSAKFQASQGGNESNVEAFLGSARTTEPARLVIPGTPRTRAMPRMQVTEPQ